MTQDGTSQGEPRLPAGCTGLDRATVVQRDGTVALRDVTVLARPGELLAVLGPSGSGKSTLLRAIAGLAKVETGRVLIAGEPTTQPRRLPRHRDGLREHPADADAGRRQEHGLRPGGPARPGAGGAAPGARCSPGGCGSAGCSAGCRTEISAGERGQVGIGRALVRTPKAFLLDEPLAHVDAHERARMRRVIAETVRASKVSTVYVTHDQSDALAIGDRIAVLNAGRLVQIGTPAGDLRRTRLTCSSPISSAPCRSARCPARLVASGGMAGYQVGYRTLPTWQPLPAELAGHVGREVTLGLRPEDVRDARTRARPGPRRACPGTVRAIDRNGRDAYLTVQVGEHRLVARFSGRTEARVGDVVTVAVDAARAHVFDRVGRDTGR